MKNLSSKIIFFACFFILANACNHSPYQQGKTLYLSNCATCHMTDGSGVSELYPALNNIRNSKLNISEMPCIIRYGKQSETSVINMQGLNHLRDIEINNIINYILNDLNSDISVEFQIDSTRSQLDKCKPTGETFN